MAANFLNFLDDFDHAESDIRPNCELCNKRIRYSINALRLLVSFPFFYLCGSLNSDRIVVRGQEYKMDLKMVKTSSVDFVENKI